MMNLRKKFHLQVPSKTSVEFLAMIDQQKAFLKTK